MQDRLKTVTDALVANSLLDGRLVTVTIESGGFTPVSHGLARPPQGYIIVRRDANATVWDLPNAADSFAFLYLQPSATVTVTLWVF